MFVINTSQSLIMNYYFFLGLHTALHVKVDLLDMLYQKSLRLGVDVRNARGVGTVVNLQSNDASKVWMMPVHIHTLWNSPFQVSLPYTSSARCCGNQNKNDETLLYKHLQSQIVSESELNRQKVDEKVAGRTDFVV